MSTMNCPHCGAIGYRIAARCESCLRVRTHRECWPEQYEHELVGTTVKAVIEGETVERGIVERVVESTTFGPLAYLEGVQVVYRVTDLVPEKGRDHGLDAGLRKVPVATNRG